MIEKYIDKVKNNNTSATIADIGICSGGVGLMGKVFFPLVLKITPKPIRVDNADVYTAIRKKKGKTSLANGNIEGIIALLVSLIMTTNNFRTCQSLTCHSAYEKYPNMACFVL